METNLDEADEEVSDEAVRVVVVAIDVRVVDVVGFVATFVLADEGAERVVEAAEAREDEELALDDLAVDVDDEEELVEVAFTAEA